MVGTTATKMDAGASPSLKKQCLAQSLGLTKDTGDCMSELQKDRLAYVPVLPKALCGEPRRRLGGWQPKPKAMTTLERSGGSACPNPVQ